MPIETVIFDLGNVLISWEPRRLYRKIFDKEEEITYFLDNICTSEWNVQQDKGRTLAEGTRILVEKYPAYAAPVEAFYGRWEEMLGGEISSSVQILKELVNAKKHRIYALTNWSAETFPVALRDYDFLQLFEGILVSGHENMIKPDREIYELMCTRYNINPTTAVFIDDSPKNVKGCEAYGMTGIHFKSGEQLRMELERLGVL
ncbi:MAG: HAD family phosphatase [Bacteroidota bacterium]